MVNKQTCHEIRSAHYGFGLHRAGISSQKQSIFGTDFRIPGIFTQFNLWCVTSSIWAVMMEENTVLFQTLCCHQNSRNDGKVNAAIKESKEVVLWGGLYLTTNLFKMKFCYGMFNYKRKFYQVIKSSVMVNNETQWGGRKRAKILLSEKFECKMCHQCLYSLLRFTCLKFKG